MLRTRSIIKAIAPASLALACTLAAPHAASAAATLDYRCDFGTAGATTAKIDIAPFTLTEDRMTNIAPAELDVAAFAAPLPSTFLQNWPGAASVEGTGKASFVLLSGVVETAQFTSDLAVERSDLGGTSLPLYGSGMTPSLARGTAFVAGEVVFHLTALDGTGQPIPYSGEDADSEAWAGADGDPSTIDLRCVVDPPTQNAVVATFSPPGPSQECTVGMWSCPRPDAPTHVRVGGITPNAAELRWRRSETARSWDFRERLEYEIELDGRTLITKSNRLPLPDLESGKTYSGTILTKFSIGGPRPATYKSEPVPFSFVAAAPEGADQTPPSVPGEPELGAYQPEDFTDTQTRVRWIPSQDNAGGSGLKEYIVSWEGGPDGGVRVPAPASSVWVPVVLTGCGPRSKEFEIRAVDNAGNESAALEQGVFNWGPVTDTPPPTVPATSVTATSTATSVTLSWQAVIPAPCGPAIASYNVYRDGVKVASVSGLSFTDNGLSSDTVYGYVIEPVDANGQAGAQSGTVTVRTKPATSSFSYGLAGSTTLKTLTRGSLALKGSADLTFGPPANLRTVNGTLDLGQTSGRLVALGFLPVTAKVGFVSSGSATGFFGGFGGSLSLSQKVRIKVLEAKLFGAIPLIGGNTCQTKQLTTLNLSSEQSFSSASGGKLTGTYAISDLNGCGALNGLVSPLTAGGGNTISVTLAPKATS